MNINIMFEFTSCSLSCQLNIISTD